MKNFDPVARYQAKQVVRNGPASARPTPVIPKVINSCSIPELTAQEIANYSSIMFYVRQEIAPTRELEGVVGSLILNMFQSVPGSLYRTGGDYTSPERVYVKKQVDAFRSGLRSLEVHFGKVPERWNFPSLGRFDRKGFRFKGLDQLMEDEVWLSQGKYSLMLLDNPQKIAPAYDANTEIDLRKLHGGELADPTLNMVFGQVFPRYEEKISGLIAQGREIYSRLSSDEKYQAELEDLDRNANDVKEYLAGHPNLSESVRGMLELFVQVEDQEAFIVADMQVEMSRLPDAQQMVSKLSQNLMSRGILVVNSVDSYNLEGFKTVPGFSGIGVYQRE